MLYDVKASGLWSTAYFRYISIALILAYSKNKLYKTLDYWSRNMFNFEFLEKYLGIVSPPYFVYDFSRKMFLVLYFLNWPSFLFWLSLLLEILGNICIANACFPSCDVINFETNLIFLIKLFFYMTKKSRQEFKYLENKRGF